MRRFSLPWRHGDDRSRNLLVEARDTATATEWTAIRDVMAVRRETRRSQRRLFLRIVSATALATLAGLLVLTVALALHGLP